MLRWLSLPEARLFSEWIEDVRLREYSKLMHSERRTEIFRAQGSVATIDLIKSLKDDLRSYEKDVIDGKVQRIREEPNVA